MRQCRFRDALLGYTTLNERPHVVRRVPLADASGHRNLGGPDIADVWVAKPQDFSGSTQVDSNRIHPVLRTQTSGEVPVTPFDHARRYAPGVPPRTDSFGETAAFRRACSWHAFLVRSSTLVSQIDGWHVPERASASEGRGLSSGREDYRAERKYSSTSSPRL